MIHVLGVGVAEIVQVVCVIVLECESVFHLLHVSYISVIKLSRVGMMCSSMCNGS